MRTITYKCDRCKKPITSRGVTRINATIQRGKDPAEKQNLDFCSTCFLAIKRSFIQALNMDAETAEELVPETKTEPAISETKTEPTAKHAGKPAVKSEPAGKPAIKPAINPESAINPAVKPEPVERIKESGAGENGLKLGPISQDEKNEILRLFVECRLTPDQIASRMNRLPRGIKRAINSATKSGEIDSMKAAFTEKQRLAKEAAEAAEASIEEDLSEKNIGSGASNAGIMRDSYVTRPKTEVINGKRYDVGGIMALHNAGWGSAMIAEERHYDQDVVRIIIEKYG